MKRFRGLVAGLGAVAALTSVAHAQLTPVKPTPVAMPTGPQAGDAAPDFSLPGATRYGLLKNPVRLSDYRGSTVVLAFFYQARTKG